MHKLIWQTGLLLCCILAAEPASAETVALTIGNQTIRAEVAATEHSREHGLMQRKWLCKNCGMLFVFEHPARHSFWMKDAELPLAIAFIDRDGNIINITEMQANTTREYTPPSDILYALEMNHGWFSRHNVQPGDRLDGLKQVPQGH